MRMYPNSLVGHQVNYCGVRRKCNQIKEYTAPIYLMFSSDCQQTKTLYRGDLFCVDCSRAYSIYEYNHTCNGLIKCADKGLSYEEEYHEFADENSRKHQLLCDICTDLRKKQSAPTFNRCRKCSFEGFFLPVNELCPECLAGTQAQMVDTKEAPRESVAPLPQTQSKPRMWLSFKVRSYASSPADGKIHHIEIMGSTRESANSDNWFMSKFSLDMTAMDDLAASAKLCDYLREISAYDYVWVSSEHSIKWMWLRYLYNCGPANKPELGGTAY